MPHVTTILCDGTRSAVPADLFDDLLAQYRGEARARGHQADEAATCAWLDALAAHVAGARLGAGLEGALRVCTLTSARIALVMTRATPEDPLDGHRLATALEAVPPRTDLPFPAASPASIPPA